jgi:hypothetical protein
MKVGLKITCKCKVHICEHVEHNIGELLQSVYDDAYDEGWNDAFIAIREVIKSAGFDVPVDTPPPPKRKKPKTISNGERSN